MVLTDHGMFKKEQRSMMHRLALLQAVTKSIKSIVRSRLVGLIVSRIYRFKFSDP